jgi:phosphoribosyl-ATP pyrophosphohydrolase/phosphoribosyl-AMP cyclohydrolase
LPQGTDTGAESNKVDYGFISSLEDTIELRKNNADSKKSYVASLFKWNEQNRTKVEEAVEVVIKITTICF